MRRMFELGQHAPVLLVTALTLAFAALISLSTSVSAETQFNITVKAGKRTNLKSFTGWDANCSFTETKIDIVEKPRHGVIHTRVGNDTLVNIGSGGGEKCLNRQMKFLFVDYTGKRGYVGPDRIRVRVKTSESEAIYILYVTVE